MRALVCCAIAAWLYDLTGAASACSFSTADGEVLNGVDTRLAWKPIGRAVIAVSEDFAIDVRACPADTELLRVDATMPAHRHGMNYKPSIETIGPGQWRVRGLLWHMRGRWELSFETRRAGGSQTLRQSIELP